MINTALIDIEIGCWNVYNNLTKYVLSPTPHPLTQNDQHSDDENGESDESDENDDNDDNDENDGSDDNDESDPSDSSDENDEKVTIYIYYYYYYNHCYFMNNNYRLSWMDHGNIFGIMRSILKKNTTVSKQTVGLNWSYRKTRNNK